MQNILTSQQTHFNSMSTYLVFSSSSRCRLMAAKPLSSNSVIPTKMAAGGHFPVNIVASERKEEDKHGQRRTANYMPSIWKYDQLQFLSSQYADSNYQSKAKKLIQDVRYMFTEVKDQRAKLQLIDSISKLGLDDYFMMEIKECLDCIVSFEECCSLNRDDLYSTALCFRLLRQHNCYASQDMFIDFFDSGKLLLPITEANVDGLLELFEASHYATDGENILVEARLISIECLKIIAANSDHTISKRIRQALSLPLRWRVRWFDVKRQINEYEIGKNCLNLELIELAKLNFNILQAIQQLDLKELVRWWENLGIVKKSSFCRDRMVESFMCAVGVSFEHQHTGLRKWLTKVIKLIMVIDDVYDVYGSHEELECFTNSVARWNPEDNKELPESMKICFWALFNTTNEIAMEIEKEKYWTSVLPYLQQAWTEFCKAMLLESKWYNNGYTPSLQEYLNNGWISSSVPLHSVLVLFCVTNINVTNISELLEENLDIIYQVSLIFRLCNDLGTSTAELERGDVPSSILCYMRESNVKEDVAREHINSIIVELWGKINDYCKKSVTSADSTYINCIINMARVGHFIYQHGDGIGIQGGETTAEFLSNLIEPFPLNNT